MNHPEHNQVRIPVLNKLVSLGWDRGQIICPSDDSDDAEWVVPNPPSEQSKREAGRKFKGDPVDLAIFDSSDNAGDPTHLIALFEFKAPDIDVGLMQLETYLGNEPYARYGYWTNGTDSAAVYKLPDGHYERRRHAELPRPSDSLIHASDEPLSYRDLSTPSEKELKKTFERLLGRIAADDSRSTRPDQRLDEIANILIIKMESDKLGCAHPDDPLLFQIGKDPQHTADKINALFEVTKQTRTELFSRAEPDSIGLDNDTLHAIVFELQSLDLKTVSPQALSTAFQVFRSKNLKIGDGQYFTPARVIDTVMPLMCITDRDKVIDPAGGTGGFVFAAYLAVKEIFADPDNDSTEADARTWAHDKLFMVDRDSINVKLARALMVGAGDGSAHCYIGDSLRSQKWTSETPILKEECMRPGSYTVVITNPPFGQNLCLSARDAQTAEYTVCKHASEGDESGKYQDTELGIVFVERAWRLLRPGGRLGIVLPETYFFSKNKKWFPVWLKRHFILRGVMNIPMEAFQGFCRAKTNFYILEKVQAGSAEAEASLPPRPKWFRDGRVWISNAPTIGINKDGVELHDVDSNGTRLDTIDNKALRDVNALLSGRDTETSRYVDIKSRYVGMPGYFDRTTRKAFRNYVSKNLPGFDVRTIGELIDSGALVVRNGHGSPSADLRSGHVPYIKVSDLRGGLVNVNSTNMVSDAIAKKFWRSDDSGLKAYDVITPSRASKNIGEMVVLMPGQENIVITKEVLIFRPGENADFDSFFLLWAFDLPVVKKQWNRVIFMQTNREDLGDRYLEIELPIPSDRHSADEVSKPYRTYYLGLHKLRSDFDSARKRQQDSAN